MNSLGEKIKKLRLQNNMTQNGLAQKLFTSNRSISHWEKGIRTPDFETIQKLAKILNVSIDYFTQDDENDESKFSDLIIVKNKENKLAIYDKSQSRYLTTHNYDIIRLSPYGIHICEKCKILDEKVQVDFNNYMQTKGFSLNYQIIKTDLVDNYGHIKSFRRPQFIFYEPFNRYGVAPIFIRNEERFALVDTNLNVLTKQKYGKIWDSGLEGADLFFTFIFNDKKKFAKDIDDYDLFDYNMFPRMVINSKGEIVFDNLGLSFSPFQSDKFPLDDIEKVEKYISKFGDALFYFINDTVFEKAENIINILDLILDNMKKNEIDVKKDKNDRKFYNDIIGQILHRKIKFCKNLNDKLCQLIFDRINKIFWTENRIEKSLYKQDVYKILHIEI